MNEGIAREILQRELSSWRAKSYRELVEFIDHAHTAEILGTDDHRYQIEIQSFWDSSRRDNVRVLGTVDDGGWRAFKPLTEDFVVAPNGEFIGEG
jgi:hypothetical protein